MKRNVYYNKAKTITYYGLQCASYKTGAMNCTNTKTISGKILEQTVLDELNGIIAQYCQSDEIRFTDLHAEQLRELEITLTKLTERQNTAKKRLVAMYKDKLDGSISEEEYRLFHENLTTEEQEITDRITDTNHQIAECRERMNNAAGQKALIQKYTHFDTLDRTVADEFIDYIEIGMPDESGSREINIHWKL